MLSIGFGISIPLSEMEFSYARSSGPGGQNVNKVNSKAVLRWNLVTSPSLPEEMRARLIHRLGDRLTRTGELIVASDKYRDQGRNREDCLEKLQALLGRAATPQKKRKPTQPTFSSQRRTREQKRRASEKKQLRRMPRHED